MTATPRTRAGLGRRRTAPIGGIAAVTVLGLALSLAPAAGAATSSRAGSTTGSSAGAPSAGAVPARALTPAEERAAVRARQQRATAALAGAVARARSRARTTTKVRFNPGPFGSGVLGNFGVNAVIRRTGCLDAPAGRRAVVVGDSLTTRTRSALDVRMAEAGIPFCMNAQGGRPSRPTVNALLDLPRDQVEAIVVASGSNDIFNPLVLPREIDRVMAYAAGAPVYWINVYVDRWAQPTEVRRADQRNTAIVNSLLVRAAARHRNLVVIDWYGFLTRVYGRAGRFLVDGVHTNNAGTDARSVLLTSALLARFGPPPAPPAPPAPPPSDPPPCPAPTTPDPGPTTSATTGPTTATTSATSGPATATTSATTSAGPTSGPCPPAG